MERVRSANGAGDESMIGSEHRVYGASWHTPEGFAAYVDTVRADAEEDAPRPAWRVPCTTLWWVEGAGGVLEDERSGKLRFWVPTV